VIHEVSAALIQAHRRLGDERLARWLGRFSSGESASAMSQLTGTGSGGPVAAAAKLAQQLNDAGVQLITILDPEYPSCFRALEAKAPPLLYVLGDVARLVSRSIAVIGTRGPTALGRRAACLAAEAAVAAAYTVVSGNAAGIYKSGHEGALQAVGGQTLVFPPAPIDRYKPVFLHGDAERVTVVSSFAPGTDVSKWLFLRRNTLVAAHCSAAFVAETGISGGTLDTVKKLLAMGRPVFATALPEGTRYARAHTMLAAGGAVKLTDMLDNSACACHEMTCAAERTLRHQPLQVAVLHDMFAEDEVP